MTEIDLRYTASYRVVVGVARAFQWLEDHEAPIAWFSIMGFVALVIVQAVKAAMR